MWRNFTSTSHELGGRKSERRLLLTVSAHMRAIKVASACHQLKFCSAQKSRNIPGTNIKLGSMRTWHLVLLAKWVCCIMLCPFPRQNVARPRRKTRGPKAKGAAERSGGGAPWLKKKKKKSKMEDQDLSKMGSLIVMSLPPILERCTPQFKMRYGD